MNRFLVFTLALGILATLGVVSAQSEEPPEHPHVMIVGVEFDADGEPLSYRQCVELAAGQALPLNAHHAHSHTGTAGAKLSSNASNFVIPLAPFSPFESCQQIIDLFFP